MIVGASNFDAIKATSADVVWRSGSLGNRLLMVKQKVAVWSSRLAQIFALAPESTIGAKDDKVPVFNTRNPPYRMICSLEIDFGSKFGIFHGTGWFAGPSIVVTAGHCLFDTGMGWAHSVAIIPGRSGDDADSRPFGTTSSDRLSVAEDWKNAAAPAADIGCIHLNEPLGDRLGWLAYGSSSINLSGHPEVRTAGYSEYMAKNSILTRSEGELIGLASGRLFYTLDTKQGASGAPIMGKQEPAQVLAVHAYDEDERVAEIIEESNSGPWIGPDVIDLIDSWNMILSPE